MAATALTSAERLHMCLHCGAPFEVPPQGGYVSCGYCNATVELRPRDDRSVRFADPTLSFGLSDAEREQRRLYLLHAQAQNYCAAGNPYCYAEAPPGVPHDLAHMRAEVLARAPGRGLEVFRGAVDRCRASRGRMRDQRVVFWVALHIKSAWAIARDQPRSRAVIETAFELLWDPGFLHTLACNLSTLACHAGYLDAAAAWLERCDPRPAILDLDTYVRMASCGLLLAQGAPGAALAVVGQRPGEIPHFLTAFLMIDSFRVEALEQMGRSGEADSEMLRLQQQATSGPIGNHLGKLQALYGQAHWGHCRNVWNRLVASRRSRGIAPIASSPSPRGGGQ